MNVEKWIEANEENEEEISDSEASGQRPSFFVCFVYFCFNLAALSPNERIARRPAALRQDFIHDGCDGSQIRMNKTSESSSIKVNQSRSKWIKLDNIVLGLFTLQASAHTSTANAY